jgi:hypothetical protein
MLPRAFAAGALFMLMSGGAGMTHAQVPGRITVMPMANTSRPADLDFQGGSCDINTADTVMTCGFQQVLITPIPADPGTCRIVTNHYTQTFSKHGERNWVNSEGPAGPCGTVTETTIEQDVRSLAAFWRVTMIVTKKSTALGADASRCGPMDGPTETLTSTDVKRPLSCTSIVAASLEF